MADILTPALGESVTEAEVGQWYVKVGDSVSVDDPIVELETDKAAMDVPAPQAGTVTELLVEKNAIVEVGAVVADCGAQGVIIGATNRSLPGRNNTLCFSPALIATADDIDTITNAVDKALTKVFG